MSARLFHKFGRRPAKHDLALVEHGHIGAGAGNIADDVRGKNDGDLSAPQFGEQAAETEAFLRVEPGGGFVHHEELWGCR